MPGDFSAWLYQVRLEVRQPRMIDYRGYGLTCHAERPEPHCVEL
jgi:hypothetical protein